MATKKVAIIGCGVGGLTSIKCCLDAGLEPTCFEKQSKFGGIWNYRDGPRPNLGSVHAGTMTNVSKATMCFSDYPMPKEWPNYMHHSRFMKYLEMYSKEFGLEQYVKLNTTVERLSKTADHKETGRWLVSYTRKSDDEKVTDNHEGETTNETFDAVLICVGHLCYPATPEFPGMKDFKGVQVHSGDYRSFHPYVGKRVVVVGSSYSASDISTELSLHASQVYFSTRQGCYMIKHLVPGTTKPFDYQISRHESFVNKYFNRSLFKGFLNEEYDFALLGLQPTGTAMVHQFPFFGDELPNRIMTGRVIVKGALKELKGSSVVFEGEDVVDNVDAVVYATGFDLKFPFASDIIKVENGHYTRLYKHVFIPDADQQTLAVIGLMETIGAHPPIWEVQARVACEVFAGRCVLPCKDDRLAECVAEENYLTKIGRPKEKFLYGVMNVPYTDDIAALIDAKPDLWSIALRDPKLAYCCFFGPAIGAHYRLQGPNAWKGARDMITSVEENHKFPLKTKRCLPKMEEKKSYFFWVFVVVFGVLLACVVRYLL